MSFYSNFKDVEVALTTEASTFDLYAAHGFKVIPVKKKDKRPYIGGWPNNGTSEKTQIDKWVNQFPQAIVGLPCGMNEIVVLDFDNAKDGSGRTWKDALIELEKKVGIDLSDHPYVVETQNGGAHYYFRQPKGIRIKKKIKCSGIQGFDFLGCDAFVVAANGEDYRLLGEDSGYNPIALKSLPELPKELVELLHAQSTPYGLAALESESSFLSKVEKGQRNDQLYKSSAKVGELISGGQLNEKEAEEFIIKSCESNGLIRDDGLDTVKNTMERGVGKGKLNPRQKEATQFINVDVPKHLKDKGLRFDCTELGNKDRFIEQHGSCVKYLNELKQWVVWDGTRWTLSKYATVHELATQTVRNIYDEARDCTNDEGKKHLTSWAFRSQNAKHIKSILTLAAQDPMINVSIQAFDRDPRKINCKNGILDLDTGEIVGTSPDDLIMQQVTVTYNLNAKCPKWDKFIREVFLGDNELINYVQRILGYTLTGLTSEQCLFMAYGLGANGKSTLFETVLDIMGDYGSTMEFSTLLNTNKSDIRAQEAIGRLKDKRYVIASETDSTKRFSEALIKKITGGDTLTGAKLYGGSYEFRPTHKIFLQVNHKPGVKDASYGFWRRMNVIPFLKKFSETEKDPYLSEKLAKEKEGIFAWLVKGAMSYLKEGIGETPKVVTEATEAYREENDTLSKFIGDCFVEEYGVSTGVSEAYDSYSAWCFHNKVEATSKQYFSAGMEERGISKKKTKKKNIFENYRLCKSEETEEHTASW